MKKAALYVRVSTGKQDVKNQLIALKEFARRRGYEVVRIFVDVASGGNSQRRAEFHRMMSAASAREFNTIFIWALDRLTREGIGKTVNLIEHLNNIGINVVSYTEPYLDTTNELARNILLAVVATLAKAEREKISERTKAGLLRLKAEGKVLGRPRYPQRYRVKVIELLRKGHGVRQTARILKVSPGYVLSVQKRGVKK